MPSSLAVLGRQVSASVATLTVSASSSIAAGDFIKVIGVAAGFNGLYTVSSASGFFVNYLVNQTNSASVGSGGSVQYIKNDSTGRPARMYDSQTDKWVDIAGKVDTGRNYSWTGAHTFGGPITFSDVVSANQRLTVNASATFNADTSFAFPATFNASANFNAPTTFNASATFTKGNNIFPNAAARDAAITSPVAGVVVFLTDSNKQFYYTGSVWSENESGDFEAFFLGGM